MKELLKLLDDALLLDYDLVGRTYSVWRQMKEHSEKGGSEPSAENPKS